MDIVDGLLAWSDGITTDRAAALLLIEHGTWLSRADFLDRCVIEVPEDGLAALDWRAISRALDRGDLTASSSEIAVLRIAASIGAGHPVDLGDALAGLDRTNARRVAAAVLTAAGADDLAESIAP